MGLPVSRDYTLAALSKIKSTLLNNLQDAIIALFGPRVHKALAVVGFDGSAAPVAVPASGVPAGAAGSLWNFIIPLTALRTGDRLLSISQTLKQTNAGATRAQVSVQTIDATGTLTVLNPGLVNAPAGTGLSTVTINSGDLPYTVPAGKTVVVLVTVFHTGDAVYGLEYTIDRQTL